MQPRPPSRQQCLAMVLGRHNCKERKYKHCVTGPAITSNVTEAIKYYLYTCDNNISVFIESHNVTYMMDYALQVQRTRMKILLALNEVWARFSIAKFDLRFTINFYPHTQI